MTTTPYYAVFAWHEARWYSLGDAIGAKAYRRETTAKAKADALNGTVPEQPWCPRGFVVRSFAAIRTDGYRIDQAGLIRASGSGGRWEA